MAHHQLKNRDEAKKYGDKAVLHLLLAQPQKWQQKLEWQLLRQEAEALLRK